MEVITETLYVSTKGNSEVIDITGKVEEKVHHHKVENGVVVVFVVGSTACITTTEYEPGLRKDIPAALDRVAPENQRYHHNDTWGDGNGYSHVRASFIGPSLTIPIVGGKLALGTWQQVVLIDCDIRGRDRKIILQIMGT
ncbi:MAG TPA: secondary thiamine-phosphate synthase enzyme YjbQ [Bacteroidota bacterium]|nr:secondary thiamine-phosphate synthase enzyme YjbQ [Bacteroidota bacterium]